MRGHRPFRLQDADGFTLVELVIVIVVLGIISAVVLPRFSSTADFQAVALRDEVVAALRHAQKSAVSRRRLVCADLGSSSVTLRIATTFPATACGAATLNGPDGNAAYASGSGNLIAGATAILFQPSGVVTDAAGTVSNFTITVGNTAPISVVGVTGRVD